MNEVLVSDNMVKKIKGLDNGKNNELLKKLYYTVSKLEQNPALTSSKKIMQLENIYACKVGMSYRLFYAIETDSNGKEYLILLDFEKKKKAISRYNIANLSDTLNNHKNRNE
ncbi:type II toxin-antitoxin system RelE/ParE family toxin [Priestia aryabhattai]|uniref:type II toxin-antitoxin system RelE/ParE family toxin n=1 Tax=Priestia aryabhattai TaxID=412384 RepID=UPI0024529AF9|nr:type II toxin-antitoxin system RelE/ParE family toxin [Priestia aryabhattai]MDH3133590.1 type II toxin-antitoxin system RelE/ParE family toxin [Priestia aryabhattai]